MKLTNFSPPITDDTIFQGVKNRVTTSSNIKARFSNITKLGKARFLVGRSKLQVYFILHEKSIYEHEEKTNKTISLIPYESIRQCEAKPNKMFIINDIEYISDVNLQIVTEIKKIINSIKEKRQTKMNLSQLNISMNKGKAVEENSNENDLDKDRSSLDEESNESFGSFEDSSIQKRDKLSKLLGITKDERLDMEADRIVLDKSTEEGRTCLQYVKDFPNKFGLNLKGGNSNPISEVRSFLDKMKRYIMNKRNEKFESLIQSGSLANSIFLGNSVEIDIDTRKKNDAIEKSLERAILIEPVRSVIWKYIITSKEDIKNQDNRLETKIRNILSSYDQNFFQIPEDLQSPTNWMYCANILHSINESIFPYQMIQIILEAYQSIPKIFQEEHIDKNITLAADDILPIMIFIITRAEIQSPLQKLEYILGLMDPLIRSQEDGYAATIFGSALSVLDDMLPEEKNESQNGINILEWDILLNNHTVDVESKNEIWKFKSTTSSETIFTQSFYPLNIIDTKAHIICLHDLHEHSGRAKALYDKLLLSGYNVHVMDWMGHGYSTGYRGLIESMDTLVNDLISLILKIKEEDERNLPIFGIGQGIGSSVLFHTCVEKPNLLSGCCFVSPIFFFNRIYTSLYGPRLLEKIAPKSSLCDFSLTTESNILEQLNEDPLVLKQKLIVKTGCTILRSQRKIPTVLQKFTTPFLFLRAQNDHLSDHQNDDEFYELAPSNEKELLVFSSCHYLLHGAQKLQVINGIVSWINSRVQLFQSNIISLKNNLDEELINVYQNNITIDSQNMNSTHSEKNINIEVYTKNNKNNEIKNIVENSIEKEIEFNIKNEIKDEINNIIDNIIIKEIKNVIKNIIENVIKNAINNENIDDNDKLLTEEGITNINSTSTVDISYENSLLKETSN